MTDHKQKALEECTPGDMINFIKLMLIGPENIAEEDQKASTRSLIRFAKLGSIVYCESKEKEKTEV